MYNTDLVIMSACETGLGDVKNGEGVYGLQRAFMMAGAKRVMMSLWKVDDEATREFMTNFYQAWINLKDIDKAARTAQQQVRKKYEHPYYWGAFVINGN
jgi:CHAT domain-containing protein